MSRKATLSNSAAMGIVSDDAIQAQARLAFSERGTSEKLAGSAVQRLCFAIMAEHAVMKANAGKEGLASLDSILDQETNAAWLAIRTKMMEFFLPAEPALPTDNQDTVSQAKDERRSRERMLERSLKLACILSKGGVKLADFDLKSGNFTIPSKLFLAPKDVFRGRAARTPRMPIDGANFLFTSHIDDGSPDGQEKDSNANASVTRLLAIGAAPKARGTKSRAGKVSGLDALPGIVAMLTAKDSEYHLASLSADLRNQLGMLAKWYAEQVASDDAAKQDDVTKAKAKRAAEAEAEKPKQTGNVQALRA
jgi:hypothetical protein